MLDNFKLRKPGPAISTLSNSFKFFIISSLILAASSFGLILLIFPKTREALQDKSKLKSGGGVSMATP